MARKLREESPPPSVSIKGILFLDDLEEIVRVFRQAERNWAHATWGDQPPVDYNPILTISVDRWECESIDDLKELGHYKDSVQIHLETLAGGPAYYFYEANGSFAAYSLFESLQDAWAIHGQISEIVNRRKLPWWYLPRRSRVLFQRSFEYKGLSATLKRHSWQIVIVVITSLATLAADETVKALWRHFHPTK